MALHTHTLELVVHTDAHEGPVFAGDERAPLLHQPAEGEPRGDSPPGRRRAAGSRPWSRTPTRANGMTLDRDGRLIVCEQGALEHAARGSPRLDRDDGRRETLVDGVPRPPAELAQRRRRHARRRDLVHRPELRPPAGLPPAAAARRRRLPARPRRRRRASSPSALRQAQRHRVLARRARRSTSTDSGAPRDRAFDVAIDGPRRSARSRVARDRPPGRPQDRRRGPRLRLALDRRPGLRSRRRAGRRDPRCRAPSTSPWASRTDVLFITTDTAVWAVLTRKEPEHDTRPHPQDHRRRRRRSRARRRRAPGARAGQPRRDRRRRPVRRAVALRRTTGAQIASSSRVAVDKARTAAIFVRPSREIEEQVTDGRLGALALHGAACADRRHPADRRRRGRRRDRHERRDARRGRGDLDRRRGRGVLDRRRCPALTYEGARIAEAAGAAAAERGVAPVVSVVDAGGALIYLVPARRRAGGERRGDDRQGAHRRDLPPAEQGLRGPGLGRPPVGAAPRARGAAAGRHADRARRRGRRRDRRERRLVGRRGPGARRDRRRRARPRNGHRNGAAFFPRALVGRSGGGLLLDDGPLQARRRPPRPARARSSCHEHAIDVMHVVQGTATVVTGGGWRATRSRRRAARRGRRARELPRATCSRSRRRPHQFIDVSDPFLYFVVKVEA